MTRPTLRFAVPPSVATAEAAAHLTSVLGAQLGGAVLVQRSESYQALGNDLLAGKIDAAWAPPFICARIEAMGARILARGVRRGASTYRSALLCRAGAGLQLERLDGVSAAWVDRDSVGGYLLPMALLKANKVDPRRAFRSQQFVGSYPAAIQAVLDRTADLTAVFAPPASVSASGLDGVLEVLPAAADRVEAFAFTEESPNDAVAVAMSAPPELVRKLEEVLLSLHESTAGRDVLRAAFKADRFEPSPRLAYRALYRVALAGI